MRKKVPFFAASFLLVVNLCGRMSSLNPRGIDVVGVDNGSHGRSCTQHPVCGHFVVVDDKLYCKWAVQCFDEEGDVPEACVQVHKLALDGYVGCHVGYLPRRLIKASRNQNGEKDGGKSYEGLWLTVSKDLRTSDNSSERSRSYRNCGILHCHVANDSYLVGKNPFDNKIDIPESMKERDPKKFNLPPSPDSSDVDDSDSDTTRTPDVNRIMGTRNVHAADDEETTTTDDEEEDN